MWCLQISHAKSIAWEDVLSTEHRKILLIPMWETFIVARWFISDATKNCIDETMQQKQMVCYVYLHPLLGCNLCL